jgi:hypothetical protein
VGSCGGLGAAALEVNAADDLEVLTAIPALHILSTGLIGAVEIGAEGVDILDGIEAPPIRSNFNSRALTLDAQLSQVAVGNTDYLGNFAGGELAEALLDTGVVLPYTLSM